MNTKLDKDFVQNISKYLLSKAITYAKTSLLEYRSKVVWDSEFNLGSRKVKAFYQNNIYSNVEEFLQSSIEFIIPIALYVLEEVIVAKIAN